MKEVKTRNTNAGTLIEVTLRDNGTSLVERFESHEGGTYETAEQKRARRTNNRTDSSEVDEGS